MGNKHPDCTLLPLFDLLPWFFQPEARVHKKAFDVVYTVSQEKGEWVEKVLSLEGQMEDSSACKKGGLWSKSLPDKTIDQL